ncbi:MAG TPA: 23S rRNA (pseudouridine(1915)-N(3))-methyltransferase RlmH [Candidatus Acidoferrales bacterium]|nr:23S rRNA (pseudouridine(1915)-N(3))-methyltransferase RlmH [Candidatus Acidoferrales bacterium]
MSMKIRMVMLGRTRNAEMRTLEEEYLKRIRNYAEVEVSQLRDGSAAAMRKFKLPVNATSVFLDANGKEFTSREFANWMGKLRDGGTRELVFFCGAAEGFPAELKSNKGLGISLSRLTMPHELARVVLLEQIYRAFAMLAGHPYPR